MTSSHLESGYAWSWNDWTFHIVSRAGIGTCIYIPSVETCIDVAQGLPFALSAKRYLITHAHQDHAGGIPYLVSQKALNKQTPPTFFVPPGTAQDLKKIMDLWSKLEGYNYDFRVEEASANHEYLINDRYFFRPFRTTHRIVSLGYCLFERRRKLKSEYVGLAQQELEKLSHEKIPLTNIVDSPLIAYTGDTTTDFLAHDSWIKKVRLLFIEMTYVGPKKSRQSAREWGHIHLEDLAEVIQQIESEKIVLLHLSRRHSFAEAQYHLQKTFSPEDLQRIELLPL